MTLDPRLKALPRIGFRAVYYCPDVVFEERLLLGVLVKTGPGEYVTIEAPIPDGDFLSEESKRFMRVVARRVEMAGLGASVSPDLRVGPWRDLNGLGLTDPAAWVRRAMARRWPQMEVTP